MRRFRSFGYLPGIYLGFYLVFTSFAPQFGIYLGKWVNTQVNVPEVPEVYLLEGFYVFPTRKSAKFHEILRKFETKWVITLLVKR